MTRPETTIALLGMVEDSLTSLVQIPIKMEHRGGAERTCANNPSTLDWNAVTLVSDSKETECFIDPHASGLGTAIIRPGDPYLATSRKGCGNEEGLRYAIPGLGATYELMHVKVCPLAPGKP